MLRSRRNRRRKRYLRPLAVSCCSMALASAVWAPSSLAAFPGTDGRIAYVQVPDGASDGEIFTALPDGSDARPLTDTPANELDPSWSADGQLITYTVAGAGGSSAIWIVNADGTNPRQVTGSRVNATPSFSPSGDRIVFAAARGIATVAVDGTHRRLLIRGDQVGPALRDPEYSPNGRRVAFSGRPKNTSGRHGGIWTMRRGGSHLKRVTRAPKASTDDAPDYSPDGRQIVFARHPVDSPRGADIILVNSDGSSKRKVPGGLDLPSFAPSGNLLVGNSMGSALGACTDLFTITPAGSDPQRVTGNCGTEGASARAFAASWQPLP